MNIAFHDGLVPKGLAVDLCVVVQILTKGRTLQGDTSENTVVARPGENLSVHACVGLSGCRPADRTCRNIAFAAEGELSTQQPFASPAIHYQHDYVGILHADLESETAALYSDGAGSGPPIWLPAGYESLPVLCTESERAALEARHDHDARGLGEQVTRNAFIRRRHHLREDNGRTVQTLWRPLSAGKKRKAQQAGNQVFLQVSLPPPFRLLAVHWLDSTVPRRVTD